MSALTNVLDAAAAVVDNAGQPGATARRKTLEIALEDLRIVDTGLDVAIAAALWVDRYGRAGAGHAMAELHSAVRDRRADGSGQVKSDE